MSDLSQRLLDAIRAAPDDDVPRLVYADWLAEHGDEPRAELLRVQLQRARLAAWEPEQVSLELRERALFADHEARWRAELPELDGVRWGRFSRGFVARAVFDDLEALKAHVATCREATALDGVAVRWAEQPHWIGVPHVPGLRELTLFGELLSDGDVDGLAACPILDGVRALNLVESYLAEDALRRLLASPHLGRLEALRLPHHLLADVSALVGASLPALVELDLSSATSDELGSGGRDGDTLDDVAMMELAAWPGLARIRSLDVSGNVIGSDGLRALLSSPYAAGLKVLRIREMVEDGELLQFDAFAAAAPGLALEELVLQGELGVEAAEQLAGAPCLASLKVLDLHMMMEAEDGAVYALTEAPWFDALRVLACSGAAGLELLRGTVPRSPAQLHTLRLAQGYGWGAEGVALLRKLGQSPMSNRLLALDLSYDGLREGGADAFAESDGFERLQSLRIRENRTLKRAALDRLAGCPLGQRVVSLEVGSPSHERLPEPRRKRMEHRLYSGPLSVL